MAMAPEVYDRSAAAAASSAASMCARSSVATELSLTRRAVAIVGGRSEIALVLEEEQDLLHRLLGRELAGVERQVGVGGRLVGVGDAGELGDDPGPRLGVEPLAVALL